MVQNAYQPEIGDPDEGIYTISVSNLYTGESTVKTLFVGTDELLQEYISNGFSADRLK